MCPEGMGIYKYKIKRRTCQGGGTSVRRYEKERGRGVRERAGIEPAGCGSRRNREREHACIGDGSGFGRIRQKTNVATMSSDKTRMMENEFVTCVQYGRLRRKREREKNRVEGMMHMLREGNFRAQQEATDIGGMMCGVLWVSIRLRVREGMAKRGAVGRGVRCCEI